jgi:hypothetical protein
MLFNVHAIRSSAGHANAVSSCCRGARAALTVLGTNDAAGSVFVLAGNRGGNCMAGLVFAVIVIVVVVVVVVVGAIELTTTGVAGVAVAATAVVAVAVNGTSQAAGRPSDPIHGSSWLPVEGAVNVVVVAIDGGGAAAAAVAVEVNGNMGGKRTPVAVDGAEGSILAAVSIRSA